MADDMQPFCSVRRPKIMADVVGDGNLWPVYARLYQRFARCRNFAYLGFLHPPLVRWWQERVPHGSTAQCGASTAVQHRQSVTETGHNAWSNRQNDPMVRVPAPGQEWLTVYLAFI